MLLYRTTDGRYLAAPKNLQFAAINGYQSCFQGLDVPDIICRAFIKEAGGFVIEPADCIELELSHYRQQNITLQSKVPLH